MIKPSDPRQLVLDIMERSICTTKVGAVILDVTGRIISWGWNHVGDGLGKHAEVMAIERANKKRLFGGIILVAGRYDRGTLVTAKPCKVCSKLLDKHCLIAYYRNKAGNWGV